MEMHFFRFLNAKIRKYKMGKEACINAAKALVKNIGKYRNFLDKQYKNKYKYVCR